VELLRTRPWSAIARVPTADGVVWFKEDPPALAFEPALTELVADRRGDCAPEVLAAEGARMLTSDCGHSLREVHDSGAAEPRWEDVLALYAELQIELMEDADRALALGVPDERIGLLPPLYAELFGEDDLLGPVHAAAERLADDGIPLTIVHQEAHDGNVYVQDGRPCFIDWAESCVSHPFVGPLLAFRTATERGGDPERLRDLYLEPFTRFAALAELRTRFADGYLLNAVCRILLWQRILAPLPLEAAAPHGDPISGWLAVLRGIADGSTGLGEA
jgi:hypothetical protein